MKLYSWLYLKGIAKTVNQNKIRLFHSRAEQRFTKSSFNTVPEIEEEEAQHEKTKVRNRENGEANSTSPITS